MTTVCGIVLGGGAAARLGRPKQVLALGGTTLLGWVVDRAESSSLDRVVVVLGAAADEVRTGLRPGRAEVVVNPDWRSGSSSSLRTGLAACHGGDRTCDAAVVILGDVPGVTSSVVDHLRAAWERDQRWAAVTSYRGRPGHPMVLAASAFGALEQERGEKELWARVIGDGDVLRVPVDAAAPIDVNTEEDYAEVFRLAEAGRL